MSQAAGRRRNSRVLVVEDNKSQLHTLTAILEDEGFDTIGCSSATEALQHVGQEDVAVAIVDLRLPALSGTELLRRFHELDDGIPVVVHTAHASYESAKDAVNHGAFAYVEKACDPDEIVYHVRRAFQQHLEQYADELEIAVAERTRELQEACEELGCEIDRRERAAEALERNEALLATILEAAPAGIGLLHDRVFQWGNIPMLEMTGYREDELLGKNAQMLYETAEEYERVGRVKYAQIRTTGTGEIDTQWRRRDGKTIHVHLRSTAINPDDLSAGVIFTATDITKRKLAEDALRESEERYRNAIEMAPDGIAIVDLKGRITSSNAASNRLLGYTNEEVLGKPFWKVGVLRPRDVPKLLRLFVSVIRGKPMPPVEVVCNHKDGTARTLECRVALIRCDGRVVGLQTISRDVTERKKAEEELRAARDQAQRYLDIACVMFVALDEQGNITLVNQRACEILGYCERDLVGKNWFETCLPEAVREGAYAVYRKLMAGHAELADNRENVVLTREGEPRLIVWRNTMLRDDKGRITGTLSSGEDVTDRRLAEDERRQLQADLAHIGRVHTVGEMAATLAHEINQPLYAIANYVRGVNRRINRGNLDLDQLADVMDRVSHEVDRAAGIISHLREFVRKGRPRRSTVDIRKLVDDVMKLLEADIRRNRITVNRQLDDDIPVVSADPVQIQQVVVNLIRNAVDAMSEVPDERRVLTIAARSTRDKTVEIAVSDNGNGVPTEIDESIFDAFFSTKDEGLGIGLAISRTIVEAHDGRLWAVSNQPQGTTFFFTIPPISEGPEDELEAYSISRG